MSQVISGVTKGSALSPYLFAAHMGSQKPTTPNAEIIKYPKYYVIYEEAPH